MNYIEQLEKLDRHITEHPKDYQAVIARMKTYSNAVDKQRQSVTNERLKRVAEIRRRRIAECE